MYVEEKGKKNPIKGNLVPHFMSDLLFDLLINGILNHIHLCIHILQSTNRR